MDLSFLGLGWTVSISGTSSKGSILSSIEAISFYENSDIRKVYWTDKLNQPRVINIAADSSTRSSWNDNSFDFIKKLSYSETVTINKNSTGSGQFASGTIQYAFTYYNKYG